MDGWLIAEMLFSLIWSLIWGFATAHVREDKGYGRRWFWFGFFCGLVPFIIACAIPPNPDYFKEIYAPGGLEESLGLNAPGELKRSVFADEKFVQQTVTAGGWRCVCGRAHPAYVSTCSCGRSKRDNSLSEGYAARVTERQEKDQALAAEVRKYKVMLDAGFISEEEYVDRIKELYDQRKASGLSH